MKRPAARRLGLAVGLVLLLAVLLAASAGRWDRATDLRRPSGDAVRAEPSAQAVDRGAYLAQVGHCAGCHTARGGAPWAGGRVLLTPFGSVVAANLTPDAETGLGRWTPEAFRRALQQGRSADGRALLPACPYPNFSLLSNGDADDLWAYLQSVPPQRQAVAPPDLRFPYGLPVALTVWRALQFEPAVLPSAPAGARGDWARGAYLVGGLGHCSACHGRRNAWGATDGAWDFRGGRIPGQGWFAPSLADPREAAVSTWTEDEVVSLLTAGSHPGATVSGPMALVVAHSTQHLHSADARAMAEFLRRLPPTGSTATTASSTPTTTPAAAPPATQLQAGAELYDQHCADCHGKAGEGVADAGPPLAGNRALALRLPDNVMRVVLSGGFGPATAAQPRPLGMPPFATLLSDAEIAAVVSHVRWRFGAGASGVTAFDVNRSR
jgi:mono/diheme cytochrome c family protein